MSCYLYDFMQQVKSEIGYKEGDNNDTKYGKWYGLNHEPWCDMFISWCANKEGGKDIIGKFASTRKHVQWFKDKDRWHKGTKGIKQGDIVFFTFSEDHVHHVGFVESVSEDYVHTIEGNTSNGDKGSQDDGGGVYRRKRKKTCGIAGYGRPKYKT